MLKARKKITENGIVWQTLADHSGNVAAKTAFTCAYAGLENLGRLAGWIHDVCKAFQLWQEYLANGGSTVFHAPYAAEFIDRTFGGIKAPCADLTRHLLSAAVRAHHGGLHDALTPSGEKDLPSRSDYSREETVNAYEAFFHEVISREQLEELFLKACQEVEQQLRLAISISQEPTAAPADKEARKNEAMFYIGMAQRLLYCALIDADRLDAACWEAGEPIPDEALPNTASMLQNLELRLNSFSRTGIGALRADISERCGSFDTPSGVYRLFVPTGGGKTLSSLRLALSIAKSHGKRRIIYAEPYLTILTQAAEEIRKAIGERADGTAAESNVLEFHSNVIFEADEGGLTQEQRYLKQSERLDSFIVLTSTVQLLNALFSGKSSSARRMAALPGSVIIVDEVQSIPTSSTYLFSLAMNYLARFCGCLIILCTATPPALEVIKYPMRMAAKPDVIENTAQLFAAFKRTQITTFPGRKFSAGALSQFAVEKLEENGNCLLIVNTKATAKKLYSLTSQIADKGYAVYYLSTALCPAHRAQKLEEIKKLLPNGKVLVISTQLIEAGVDISFKCVIRSMAGLDSIIQAAGRCNRHGELELGNVYAVDFEDENLSMLTDIAKGKQISLGLAAQFSGSDLSSPALVRRYYEEYFCEEQARLDYSIDKTRCATSLLGYNRAARREYGESNAQAFPQDMLAQSFRYVGCAYKPITENTTGVVTPYGNSKELLEKLRSSTGKERQRYARLLQKSCVNLYDNQLSRLEGAGVISFDEEAGIWVLEESAYNEISGIDTNWEESVDKYIL